MLRIVARSAFTRLAARPLLHSSLRAASSSSSPPPPKDPLSSVKSKMEPEQPADPLAKSDAFRYNMFASTKSFSGLVLVLCLWFGYGIFFDATTTPEPPQESAEDFAARMMGVPRAEIAQVRSDGRVLMVDGSIRSP